MVDLLTFPNVEAQAMVYLTPRVGVPVQRVLPNDLPDEFVRVILTGTRRINLTLLERRLTVECWALTDAAAHDLAALTYAHLSAWRTDSVWVPHGEDGWAGGPYADIDPDTKRPQYVMTANVRQGVTTI